MGNYAIDLQLAGDWRASAAEALQYDLEPVLVSSCWQRLDLARGSQALLTIQAPHDLWMYGLRIDACKFVEEDQVPFTWYHDFPRYIAMMPKRNQSELYGSFVDAVIAQGDTSFDGLGPGWILRQGEVIQIQLRRMRGQPIPGLAKEDYQATIYCSYLHASGTYRYRDDLGNSWRNLPRELWGAGSCVLRAQQYGAEEDVDTTQPLIATALDIRTGERPFLLDRIQMYRYPIGDMLEPVAGSYYLFAPYTAEIAVHGDPLCDQSAPPNGIAWGGMSGYNPVRWRIPRLIPPDSLIRTITRNPGWPNREDPEYRYGIQLIGRDLWGGTPPVVSL